MAETIVDVGFWAVNGVMVLVVVLSLLSQWWMM